MDPYLAISGFLIILAVIGLLMWGKVHPIVAMVLIPVIGVLIAGFGFDDLAEFFSGGADQVMDVAIMFIFAIIFFGIMNDIGLFNPIIKNMIIFTKGNVIVVAIVTIIIGAIAHLDGAGATTYLLTVPALIGLYRALNMSPMLLLMLATFSLGFMNVVPWGGPVGRLASVLGYDNPAELWFPLIPWQIGAFVLAIGFAVVLGIREKKRIEKRINNGEIEAQQHVNARAIADDFIKQQKENEEAAEEKPRKHPAMLWLNGAVLLGVLLLMLLDIAPPGLAFMIGLAIVLPLNYRSVNDQMGRIRAHAPAALMMASIILAAGLFLGVMTESGMLDSLAMSIVGIVPDAVGPYTHVIVAFFGIPLDIIMSTDAYYFGIFPVVESVASNFGVASESTAYMMLVSSTFSQGFLSPAMWLGVGLAGVQIGQFMKYAFFWFWGFGIIGLILGFILGIY
ncbi:citrate transporter [Salicibibacter cibarius]|uniref:Citrate transporter n=1 Tax=Salicibibacter cibarius TaxID=2743000 RepID=A0A7T7CAX3_9BACI|nr:citrate:proton symporter [Salicibibacter cibarius]QQK75359.1 citrate transporter [Salicibibacter cibarius]